MSRKTLVPVALITQEARRISDRNLDSRLPVSPANDELSDLSHILNGMLARIDAGFRSVRDFTANASHELRTPLARFPQSLRSLSYVHGTQHSIGIPLNTFTKLRSTCRVLSIVYLPSHVPRQAPKSCACLRSTFLPFSNLFRRSGCPSPVASPNHGP